MNICRPEQEHPDMIDIKVGGNVRRDKDNFMTFLVRRLPQRIPAKLILVLVSNRLDWPEHLDPRVKSFLKVNELIFKPYNAMDLQHILRIRVEKALHPKALKEGVIEKIAAMASKEHGDARKAIALLAKSAYLAEKDAGKITLNMVDEAATELARANPEEIFFVDDRAENVAGALEAGFDAVQFTSADGLIRELLRRDVCLDR